MLIEAPDGRAVNATRTAANLLRFAEAPHPKIRHQTESPPAHRRRARMPTISFSSFWLSLLSSPSSPFGGLQSLESPGNKILTQNLRTQSAMWQFAQHALTEARPSSSNRETYRLPTWRGEAGRQDQLARNHAHGKRKQPDAKSDSVDSGGPAAGQFAGPTGRLARRNQLKPAVGDAKPRLFVEHRFGKIGVIQSQLRAFRILLEFAHVAPNGMPHVYCAKPSPGSRMNTDLTREGRIPGTST